ncbi:MAG TPA: leucine-rich repeat domain-containing protein [Oscillospiraceae bacterium]|nr:leucine-rich repeat domain-containing protein [Oscillospiraceae bacterium]
MKKIISFCLVLTLVFSVSGCALRGGSKENLKFKPVQNGYALYRFKGGSLQDSFTVPDTYKGEKVVEVMDFAIANAEYLKTIIIGKNISTIEDWGIVNCPALKEIEVAAENTSFTSINGVLYSKDLSRLIAYPNGNLASESNGGTAVLIDSIKEIANNAFYQCDNLYEIKFNDGLVEIGDKAFIKCSNLKNFTFPNSLEKIGDDAFSYCDSLTEITIPESVNTIGDFAFYTLSGNVKKVVIQRENSSGITLGKNWLPLMKGEVNKKCELAFEP